MLGGKVPRFSDFFGLGLSQAQLDFVDVSNEYDTPVYVDPYAIEVQDDEWAGTASDYIRIFFNEVLEALTSGDKERARNLMANLREPAETFLGVSNMEPKGRGVGSHQANQLINAILGSKAFSTKLLTDLSEMALYVEGIDRDKISDLTTNVIRELLVDYTQSQCELYDIETRPYNGPPLWDASRRNWRSKHVNLPYIENDAVILVPKYIVRRKLSLNSQDFYNKQITDFLVSENIKANSSLVQTIKGRQKVYKKDIHTQHPKSKNLIADMVGAHPDLLEMYKEVAKKYRSMVVIGDDDPTVTAVCGDLASLFERIPAGAKTASDYHRLIVGSFTALFYPSLILPRKEWEIHDGRKRIDIAFMNSADGGFFGQRRDDRTMNANMVLVECKNYTDDLANEEVDQLLGRFDENIGKFGFITCRSVDNLGRLEARLRDAAVRKQGYIICLTDEDMKAMLIAKSQLRDEEVDLLLYAKFRDLIS
ncbi:hypothetical protein K32_03590 [Kaistia sp. 32K]|uniref:hypothetical protein n=1 Tax=Kaistia sp. 32K TaxID=2795690 RepID=UPI001916714B|nr:hypothetical protein [Kaistia sp. 32K]BCP51742.1 hypothetical protein K32_03590 [Kaistia sp. 32K]